MLGPHQKIIEMLSYWDIEISKGTICNILNEAKPIFKEDLKSARDTALNKCSQALQLDLRKIDGQQLAR